MTSINQIKRIFRENVSTAVGTTVDDTDIRVATNEIEAEYPSILFDTFVNSDRVFLNDVERDINGNVIEKNYHEFITAVFDTFVMAENETQKDELVSDIRSHFSRYTMDLQPSDFDQYCRDVDVQGTQNSDVLLSNEVVRGDRIRIEIQFVKIQTVSV